tara:strand:- start:114 stop:1085 length:972 start_codon:yes stop_codon:yes gene_type:complete
MRKSYKKYSYPHGITFHHFHDNVIHKKSQGSINAYELKKIINFVGRKNIKSPAEFFDKVHNKKLKKNDLCLTFDDGSKTQFDIALNVLNDFKIKGFFFIPSNIFSTKPDYLEIYRFFRNNYFKNIDEFYSKFFEKINRNYEKFIFKNKNNINKSLKKFNFFSFNDVKFRLIRDNFLSKKEYDLIMKKLFKDKKFNPYSHNSKLFMSKNDLRVIFKDGHNIGLHSHTHPTKIEKFTEKKQYNEYFFNKKKLSHILNISQNEINTMAHPCGSFNNNTLNVLKKLNIELGFSNLMPNSKKINSKIISEKFLEIPRNDHSIILKLMK